MNATTTTNGIEFTRINNDVNGNPRFAVHFLALVNDNDRKKADENKADTFGLTTLYNIALKKARKIGGRKFHNKQYGGGIIFQSYNTNDLADRIKEIQKA